MTTTAPDIEISEELIRRFDILGPRYTSYPTADRFHAGFGAPTTSRPGAARAAAAPNPPLSLYVHMPFCESLCYYCACNKIITKDHSKRRRLPALPGSAKWSWQRRMLGTGRRVGAAAFGRRHADLPVRRGTGRADGDAARRISTARAGRRVLASRSIRAPSTPTRMADAGASSASTASASACRTSIPEVQKAVNRIQPLRDGDAADGRRARAMRLRLGQRRPDLRPAEADAGQLRAHAGPSDRAAPDRIALYSYAHLPERFKPQRRIVAADLPSAEAKLADAVADVAARACSTPATSTSAWTTSPCRTTSWPWRSARAGCTAISRATPRSRTATWSASACRRSARSAPPTASRRTPSRPISSTWTGPAADRKRLRAEPGRRLRRQSSWKSCAAGRSTSARSTRYGIDFTTYFAAEMARLATYQEAGLIDIDGGGVSFRQGAAVRARVGLVFDKYLRQPTTSSYSKLI